MLHQVLQVMSCLVVFATTANAVRLQHSIPICCNNGTTHANRYSTCEAIDSAPIPDIGSQDVEDLVHCRIIMRSCCVQELQKGMCIKGLDYRATNGSCDTVQPDGCASVEKTCCECCELGMKAYWESARAPCEGTDLGTECDFAFRECCMRASSANYRNDCSLAQDRNEQLCSMKCVNLISSYACECAEGFYLASDKKTCIRRRQELNDNPCEDSPCEQRCLPNGSAYQCACIEGYRLQDNGYTCQEDEMPSASLACMFANCEYGCRPIGLTSYECYCEQGYDLDLDRVSCIDIDECQEENICPFHKQCVNYAGSFYCRDTQCREGEHFDETTRSCRDVDECSLGLNDCPIGTRCDNLPGSYRCTRTSPCGTGYTVNATTQRCDDIDECFQDSDDCPSAFYCENTMGSYKCRPCPTGFKADTSDRCSLDIDECEENPGICELGESCFNTEGSFYCSPSCPTGLQYSDIYQECRDINECALGVDNCNHMCLNTDGSFTCQCQEGFELNPATNECVDIDECRRGTHECHHNQQCYNYPGHYACQRRCQISYRFNGIDCVDINECEQENYPCLGNAHCVNTPGSFRCWPCPRGQMVNRDTRRCEDVDECADSVRTRCMGGCKNTFGSYTCTCPNGYNLASGTNCRDIDECRSNIHNCSSQSSCFNTRGGFKCKNIQCPQYFRKQISGNEIKCAKVSLCPNHDYNCLSDPVRLITYTNIALPSITRDLAQPLELLRLQVGDLNAIQVYGLQFVLTQGNELGLFSVTKTYDVQPNGRYKAIGVLQLNRAIVGPYETDLRMEMQLYRDGVLLSVTVAVFSIDVSPQPY